MILLAQQQGEIDEMIRNVNTLRLNAEGSGWIRWILNPQAQAWTTWIIRFSSLLRTNLQWFAMDRAAMPYATAERQRANAVDCNEAMRRMLRDMDDARLAFAQYPRMEELFREYSLQRTNDRMLD